MAYDHHVGKKIKISKEKDYFETKHDKTVRRDTKMERLALQAGIALGLAWPHQCPGWLTGVCFMFWWELHVQPERDLLWCCKKRHLIPVMPFSELQTQSSLPIRCHTSSVTANSSPGNSFDSIPSELRGVRQAAHHQTPALEAPIQSTGSAGLRKLVEAHLSPTPPKKTRLEGWRWLWYCEYNCCFFAVMGMLRSVCVCVCSLVIDSWYEYSRSMPQLCDLHRWLGFKNWNMSKRGWSPLPHT